MRTPDDDRLAFLRQRYEAQPVDELRGDFNQHVIGPLSHVAVAYTLDGIGPQFLTQLEGELGQQIQAETKADIFYNRDNHAVTALEKVSRKLRREGEIYISNESPLTDVLSPEQRAAATRLGTPRMRGQIDGGLFNEMVTIHSAITIIQERHPELELGDTHMLTAFLRHPETPRIFRGFGHGGNAFVDGFIQNGHPATRDWWNDREKPVLDTSADILRVTAEVHEAALRSRALNEELLDHALSPEERELTGAYGLTDGVPKRFSSGCPAKFLSFKTDVPSLGSLTLSSAQVDSLIELTTPPAIRRVDDTRYVVVRDSYAETSHFLADALELVA